MCKQFAAARTTRVSFSCMMEYVSGEYSDLLYALLSWVDDDANNLVLNELVG